MTTVRIAVLGPNDCSPAEYALGVKVGAGIAVRGGTLLCGGLGGMMDAAAKGAKSEDGRTVGILPGDADADANPHIDIALPTGIGAFRNMLIVRAADAAIAIRGGYGTLSEIAFALRLGVPVVGLNTWSVAQNGAPDGGIHLATTPEEAVDTAFRLAGIKR